MRVVGLQGDGLCVGYEGVVVDSISTTGVVGRDGRLREGDQLLRFNGASLVNMSLDEARELLRQSRGSVALVAARPVHVSGGSERGYGGLGSGSSPQVGQYSLGQSMMPAKQVDGGPPTSLALDQTVRSAWHNGVVRSLFGSDPQRDSRRQQLLQSLRERRLQGGPGGLSLSMPHGLSRTMQRFRGGGEVEHEAARSVVSMQQSRHPISRESARDSETMPAWDGEDPTLPYTSNSKWASLFLDRRFLFLRVEPMKGASMGLHVRCRPVPGTPLHLAGRKPALQFMSVTSVSSSSPHGPNPLSVTVAVTGVASVAD